MPPAPWLSVFTCQGCHRPDAERGSISFSGSAILCIYLVYHLGP